MSLNVSKEKLHINVARLKKAGDVFEVVVDPDKAMEYRQGKADLSDVIQSDEVFHDAKKGELASEQLMQKVFNTDDKDKIIEAIIKHGEIQLSGNYRTKMLEEKVKQIVNHIHRNAIDPKTGYPHPPDRIRNAMTAAKVHVDDQKSAEEQIPGIVKAISSVLPISIEVRKLELVIPAEYGAKCYSTIKGMARIMTDRWMNDGSWHGQVEVAAGLQQELLDKLNAMTHGNITTKIME
ncbi:MAG: ribosome assembly factor SBDS [Nanoarchaeota archaeon]|nr:ribosome assembly factor SBDS [Nanoarchaeota archaeon]